MQYGLVHIAAGDLLRAEVAAETENGQRAKEYTEKGMLVPDEVVVTVWNQLFHYRCTDFDRKLTVSLCLVDSEGTSQPTRC